MELEPSAYQHRAVQARRINM